MSTRLLIFFDLLKPVPPSSLDGDTWHGLLPTWPNEHLTVGWDEVPPFPRLASSCHSSYLSKVLHLHPNVLSLMDQLI